MVEVRFLSKRFKWDNNPNVFLTGQQLQSKNQFLDYIHNQSAPLVNVNCPLCQNTKGWIISEKDRYGFYHKVVLCSKCSLIYLSQRYSNSIYEYFYKNIYRKIYGDTSPEELFKCQIWKGRKIFEFISKVTDSPISNKVIVEIGSGAGGILKYFKDKGNTVLGVDYGNDYLKYGREKGLDLFEGGIDAIAGEIKKSPHIIIYSHVFEHILNPKKELENIRNIMNDNTILYVEVPGIYNPLYGAWDFLDQLQNAHTMYFHKNSLAAMLKSSGFEAIFINNHIRGLFIKCSDLKKVITIRPERVLRNLNILLYLKFIPIAYYFIRKCTLVILKRFMGWKLLDIRSSLINKN